MFLEQDPFRQLKDLSLLKDQLEDIQRRVEDEVGVGIPQAGLYIFVKFRTLFTDCNEALSTMNIVNLAWLYLIN